MSQQKQVDLHVHTAFSDGTFSPWEVIERAKNEDLAAVAICDHDSILGIEPAIKHAEKLGGIEVIPGVELTAEDKDMEIHILGFFIDWQDRHFGKRLEQFCQARAERAQRMIKKLQEMGLDIEEAEVFKLSGAGSIGRLHLAQVLHKRGLVQTVDEAFRKYIGDNGPAYVKKFRLTPSEAIEEIIKIKGVAVLAHPYKIMDDDELISRMVKSGLRGIEVYHPDHPPYIVKGLLKLAKKHGLIITGGSDCHGMGKGKVLIGKVRVPYEVVDELRKEAGD